MRKVASLLAVTVVFGAASGCGPGADEPDESFKGPDTAEEVRAAEVALLFATRVRAGDARGACRLLEGDAFFSYRCASERPRIPRNDRIAPDQKLEVVDAQDDQPSGTLRIAIPVAGTPVMAIYVSPRAKIARVSGFGLA